MTVDELAELAGTGVPSDAGAAFLQRVCGEATRAEPVDPGLRGGFTRALVVGGIAKAAVPPRRTEQHRAVADLSAWDELADSTGAGRLGTERKQQRSRRPVTPSCTAELVLFTIGCRLAEALVKH